MEINGKFTKAKIFTNNIDAEALAQVQSLCDNELLKNSKIRIMPDVHYGNNCVVGFTATLGDFIDPHWIGVDIGCGLYSVNISRSNISFDKLDKFIRRNIPLGNEKSEEICENIPKDLEKKIGDLSERIGVNTAEQLKYLSSLGGGNHFIEIGKDKNGDTWVVIHTGSRGFGYNVASFYQEIANAEKARRICKSPFLTGEMMMKYINSVQIAQEFASLNRKVIMGRILDFLRVGNLNDSFETIHNYIDLDEMIIRKGAISAKENEKVMIPLNMRDGIIIARGKGNSDWNFSAPHGAGRRISRSKAKSNIGLDVFRHSMKKVWSSSISAKTLDEAPQAYKSKSEIIDNISDTVEILDIITPIYNFKGF